jgi:ribose 5-phosphate isomerase B
MPHFPILLGSDHAGYALKEHLRKALIALGYDVCDCTPDLIKGDDYPIIGKEIARAISNVQSRVTSHESRVNTSRPPLGILVCGSGVGVAIAANRVRGARAVEGFSVKQVKLAREHNDANILTLGEWNTPPAQAIKIVRAFLETPASKEKRHRRRIEELG